jgi:HpcH/HpaI aldolase/citrate lyase family
MMLSRIFSRICFGSTWAAAPAPNSVKIPTTTRLLAASIPSPSFDDNPRSSNSQHHHQRHALQISRLKDLLIEGKPVRGVVSGQYGDTDHIEMLGLLGYDFLWADAEHSSASSSDISRCILAADCRGLPTLVRVGYGYQNTIGHIQKYLVEGAQGIILPQCESASDVQRVVCSDLLKPCAWRIGSLNFLINIHSLFTSLESFGFF